MPEQTGHPIGGVCPFALKRGVRVFLDESLKQYDFVYPAAGAPNNAVEKITIERLQEVTGGKWIDVSKTPEQPAGGLSKNPGAKIPAKKMKKPPLTIFLSWAIRISVKELKGQAGKRREPFGRCRNLGGIAQLGERLNGIQEVSGSIPLISTNSRE